MATHSVILAWEISWTQEPVGYRPWGLKQSDTSEQLNTTHTSPHQKPARVMSTHSMGRLLRSGVVAENFKRIWDLKMKVCVGREESGRLKNRRASFTCINDDRNVNIVQLVLQGLDPLSKLLTAYQCLFFFLLGMGEGNMSREKPIQSRKCSQICSSQNYNFFRKHKSKEKMLLPEPEEEAVSWCIDSNLIKKVIFWTSTHISLVSPDDQGHSLLSLMCWPSKLPSVQGSCQSQTLKSVPQKSSKGKLNYGPFGNATIKWHQQNEEVH